MSTLLRSLPSGINIHKTRLVSHNFNKDYDILLIEFPPDCPQFQKTTDDPDIGSYNWMPTDDDVLQLLVCMVQISPTFKDKLLQVKEALLE